MATEHDIDDGLTDEERAALEESESESTGPDEADENNDDAEGVSDGGAEDNEGEEDSADGDANGGDSGTGDAAGTPAAADGTEPTDAGAEQQTVEATQSAPILVVDAPADAAAKLTEIGTKKDELFTKFDDGDITAKEYQAGLDALNKQERDIELDIREAKLAEKMEAQRQANDWKATVDAFIAKNPRYSPEKSQSMYQLLDLEVRRVAGMDEFKNRSDAAAGREILAKAHENIAKDLGFDAKPAAPKAPPAKKPDAIPSLHGTPAADQSDVSGGKYAVLDRLASSDPLAYEEALMKLPDGERNAYLAN